MEQSRYLELAMQMIGLTRCAVRGETPDASLLDISDPEGLLEVCQSHILTACTAYALESAGIRLPAFTEAKEKAVRKNILLDTERKKILAALEAAGIFYMPLKGVLIKEWYPRLGMRQMSDNDILINSTRRQEVREIMESLGFHCEHFGTGYNDAYAKPPVCYFEMHSSLFSEQKRPEYFSYYADLEDRLLKDGDSAYGRHFSPEDFYIYHTVHAYKHFSSGGTGVRTLLDFYIILKHCGEQMDTDYIAGELDRLGICDFEAECRTLSEKLFTGQPLSAREDELLRYHILSGTYGTKAHLVENRIRQSGGSRLRYALRRVFPPMNEVKEHYPFFYRHKLLMPALWIYRPFRALTGNRSKLSAELRQLFRKQK